MSFYKPDPSFLVDIEGGDGSGKATQTELLVRRLNASDFPAASISSPMYGHPFAWFVEEYKRGGFGPMIEVDPFKAATFFAMSRVGETRYFEAIKGQGKLVVTDRWTASNFAHQGAKLIGDDGEMNHTCAGYLIPRIKALEWGQLGIAVPRHCLILDVAPKTARELLESRVSSGGEALDGHEVSLSYQSKVRSVYHWLAKNFPKNYTLINSCDDSGQMLSPEAVHELVWQAVSPILGL